MAKKTTAPVQEDTAPMVDGIPGTDTAEETFPYEAAVTVPLLVVRKGSHPIPLDKPVGTLTKGTCVTVTASVDGFAMLSNGTYVKEAYLERRPQKT